MRILALEPYNGGSHEAFLDGWIAGSRHCFTVLGLPARKWKWRMRHAALTFADQVRARVERGEEWDVVFCSDMLNLAEFRGLAPVEAARLPCVAYFHENQLTYPCRHEDERDYHYGFINMTTALAADEVWFNSRYHQDAFLGALDDVLRRMPDNRSRDAVARIGERSRVEPPGIQEFPSRPPRTPGPARVLWAARWEHDKNPELFFDAMELLLERGVPFRMSVLGQQFRVAPEVFARARERFAAHLDDFGHHPLRKDYEAALLQADVIVSTAEHEFFGLSVAEAVAAGAWPLVPARLAYPEVLGAGEHVGGSGFFHDDRAASIADRLQELADGIESGGLWSGDPERGRHLVDRFTWERRRPELDDRLELVAGRPTR